MEDQPKLTEDDVKDIYDQGVAEHGEKFWERAFTEAQGEMPKETPKEALVSMGVLADDQKKTD